MNLHSKDIAYSLNLPRPMVEHWLCHEFNLPNRGNGIYLNPSYQLKLIDILSKHTDKSLREHIHSLCKPE